MPSPTELPLQGASAQLIERTDELAVLTEALDASEEQDGEFVVIQGEPGIGKSRLLDAAASSADQRGTTVMRAAGDQLELGFPFGVVRQLLTPTLAALPADARAEVLAGTARQAAELIGRSPGNGLAEDTDIYVYLDALLELVRGLSARRPLALLVDDAQWADAPSLRFLSYLTRRLAGLHALVVLAVRPDQTPAHNDLVAHLLATDTARLMTLEPLSPAGVGALLEDALQAEVPEAFAKASQLATGGIPFFLGELAEGLRAAHVQPAEASLPAIQTVTTAKIERAVHSRLAGLPEPATQLARAVVFLGEAATVSAATAVAQVSDQVAAEMVDHLAAARILQWHPPLRPAHPIISAAIAAGVPPATRSSFHARCADFLAATDAPDEQIAAHVVASDPQGDSGRIPLLTRAARAATSRGAAEHAVVYLKRALDEPPPLADRGELLRELGWAQLRAGQPEGEQKLRDSLALAMNAEERAQISLRLGRALVGRGDIASGISVLDRAIATLGSAHPDLAAELELDAVIVALLGNRTTAAHRARILAFENRHPKDGRTLAIRAYLGACANQPADQVARFAEDALRGDRGAQEPVVPAGPLIFHALCALIWSERYTIAVPLLEGSLGRARRAGSTPEMLVCMFVLTMMQLRQGRLQEVEELGQEALEIGTLHPAHLNMRGVLAHLAEARVERGDIAGAQAALETAGPLDDTLQSNLFLHAQALTALAAGHPEMALDLAETLQVRLALGQSDAPGVSDWRTTAAFAHLRLGEHAEARSLLRQQLSLARSAQAPRTLGRALAAAARTEAHGASREAMLRESLATLDIADAPLTRAHVLVDLGSELRRQRRAIDARVPLEAARQLAADCGAEPLRIRAVEELAATGQRRNRQPSPASGELTVSERRTAILAADGLTNREIAKQLYLSIKTVETQLGSSFRKLGISSRKELPSALTRSGAGELGRRKQR